MNGSNHAMFHLPQRALRALLLLTMAWMLGASGVSHTHAGKPFRAVTSFVTADAAPAASIMEAAAEDDDCAICVWKAQTPYVPPQAPTATLPVTADGDHQAAAPRAPPASTVGIQRTRAPPSLLS